MELTLGAYRMGISMSRLDVRPHSFDIFYKKKPIYRDHNADFVDQWHLLGTNPILILAEVPRAAYICERLFERQIFWGETNMLLRCLDP